jgi:hypothetical protein
MNFNEARSLWASDAPRLAGLGIHFDGATSYLPDEFRSNYGLAMDAQPALTTVANSSLPSLFTTFVDPEVTKILFSPNKAAVIFGEVKKGDWLLETTMFPVVEHTGEVSSYGDYAENGSTGVNMNWPNRQSYLFQTVKQYGDREVERAGLSKLNFISEIDQASVMTMDKFMNLSYFFGIAGLQNYGLLNDPNLSASLTPATKAYGGTAWISGGVVKSTANEIFTDIQSLFYQLQSQAAGNIEKEDAMTLSMSPDSAVALTATNSFNVNVEDLFKKNFPNMTVKTAVQYGTKTASNSQGIVGGNLVQLICASVEGQKTGHCAFSEKQRSHPIIRAMSSYKQKITAGTWGAVIRQPFAISSMLGI